LKDWAGLPFAGAVPRLFQRMHRRKLTVSAIEHDREGEIFDESVQVGDPTTMFTASALDGANKPGLIVPIRY
jgi:hypothetical protein